MWRIQGLVGRVLSRYHGNPPSLRLSNGHHVEDEVISSSSVLSTSRCQRGDDREQKNNKRTPEFCSAGIPRYSALDAVGWGAAAVLFMQICRRIHSQFSSVGEHNPGTAPLPEPSVIRKCTHKLLHDMLSGHIVPPGGVCALGVNNALTSPEQSSSSSSSSSSNVYQYSSVAESAQPIPDPQGATFHHNFDTPEALRDCNDTQTPDTDCTVPLGHETPRSLDEAERNLRDVAGNSVNVILNIIGLESAKSGNHKAAFESFQASAQQDYSKAQFNAGVCYETGRGVEKDLGKALQFYKCAASAGHPQAQYRCAKLLLNSRGQRSAMDAHTATAISLLQSAAAAGLTEAQLYLGVLLSRDPDADEGESVRYFRMAANSGDSTGLLFLGQCYERGFGVPLCYKTALRFYEKAAAKGNQQAQNKLDLHKQDVLRSIRSAPCLSVLDRLSRTSVFPPAPDARRHAASSTPPIPHSWSTGNLVAPPPFTAHALGADCRGGGWIIGVG